MKTFKYSQIIDVKSFVSFGVGFHRSKGKHCERSFLKAAMNAAQAHFKRINETNVVECHGLYWHTNVTEPSQ